MDQIKPFKNEYIKATQGERLILMKTKIMPAMFNYLITKDKRPSEAEGPVKTKVSRTQLIIWNSISKTHSAATGDVVRKQLAHVAEGSSQGEQLGTKTDGAHLANSGSNRQSRNGPACGNKSREGISRAQTNGTVEYACKYGRCRTSGT